MGTSDWSNEFKRDAVEQITVRGYPVREVARRLGVSSRSLSKLRALFGEPVEKMCEAGHEAEYRRWKHELARMTQEPDILKAGGADAPLVRAKG